MCVSLEPGGQEKEAISLGDSARRQDQSRSLRMTGFVYPFGSLDCPAIFISSGACLESPHWF